MNTKEIAISSIVLISLLAGLFLLIRFGQRKAGPADEVEEIESGAVPTTENLDANQGLEASFSKDDGLAFESTDQTSQDTDMLGFESKRSQLGQELSPPPNIIKEGVDYQAVIQTNLGDIKVDLLEDKTPITVNNFVYLANRAFYDGLAFHRVIDNFMIQGGDPLGDGRGGPGYTFEDEIVRGQVLDKGSLAMANSGKDTNGSQFFIITKDDGPAAWLNKAHTKFGQVIEGQEIADKISKLETDQNDKPLEEVTINTVVIFEN